MNTLIVNSTDPYCGVYQFGLNLAEILSKSPDHEYNHQPIGDRETFLSAAKNYDLLIVNWHEKLFPWLDDSVIEEIKIPVAFVGGHDYYPSFKNQAHILDATSCNEATENLTPIPRPVRDFPAQPNPESLTIGSCGFNFHSKNFQHVATVVAQSFDEALIRLHISQHPHGDNTNSIVQTIQQQLWNLGKPNIKVEVSTDFLTDEELIGFLASNTANVFLYPPFEGENRGLSSTIDKALAARKPFAISDSSMYRHIMGEDKFRLAKHSLAEIISFGTKHIEPFWEMYSEQKLIETVNNVVVKLCS